MPKGGETLERIFDLDPQLIQDAIILAINIFILFILLSYMLFNPVRDMLKKRQDSIQGNIDKALSDKDEAEKMKAMYEDKLKNADKEVDIILSEARKKALKREEQIVEQAKEEAARIIARANEEAELEKKKAADEIKQEMITVASLMAAKVVRNSINAEVQSSLVEETIKEMGDNTWLS